MITKRRSIDLQAPPETDGAFVYLGLAAIAVPNYAGSWGTTGGILATLGGWGFIGATVWEARKSRGEGLLTQP